MIQTEPDYGGPKFKYSSEEIGDWSVVIQTANYEHWVWSANRNDGDVNWELVSQNEELESYDAAKAHCVSVIESLTPDGFTPQSYVSIEDASNKINRLKDGRWFCMRGEYIGDHDFATASLAAAAHDVETYI